MTNDGWGKDWVNSSDWYLPKDKIEVNTNPNSKGASFNLIKQGSNLVDDEAYLYFQCSSCNNIFDPHTKSFKTLNDKRFEAGWKVKWNVDGMGYKVYCVECGEKVK